MYFSYSRIEDREMEQELELAIGIRIRKLRLEKGLTLDDLAEASGVSRAMISRIERAEASPTASLLARVCAALGLSLSTFFADDGRQASPISRRRDQQIWRDPETGYLRRAVSPAGTDPTSTS
jgi:transcriptional regulator with XRE-family HTH domain